MSRSEIIVGVYGGRGWEEGGGGGGGDGDGSLRGRMVCKRRSSVSLPFSPLAMVGGRGGFSRKSFSYSQLPQEPLKLSVLKLDGSCFGNSLSLSPSPFSPRRRRRRRVHFTPVGIGSKRGRSYWAATQCGASAELAGGTRSDLSCDRRVRR